MKEVFQCRFRHFSWINYSNYENCLTFEQALKEEQKKIPPSQMFISETDKYSKFDDKVRATLNLVSYSWTVSVPSNLFSYGVCMCCWQTCVIIWFVWCAYYLMLCTRIVASPNRILPRLRPLCCRTSGCMVIQYSLPPMLCTPNTTQCTHVLGVHIECWPELAFLCTWWAGKQPQTKPNSIERADISSSAWYSALLLWPEWLL